MGRSLFGRCCTTAATAALSTATPRRSSRLHSPIRRHFRRRSSPQFVARSRRLTWKAQPFPASLGERQIWTVKNETKFAHPFHLHGFFFLPLDEKLQPIHPMVWKDTLNVPIEGTVRFLVVFDERPRLWMFHCHILDHADGGLMGHVQVGSTQLTDHVHRNER